MLKFWILSVGGLLNNQEIEKKLEKGIKVGPTLFTETTANKDSEVETCVICGGCDNSGVITKSVKSSKRINSDFVRWKECSVCKCWYHNYCLMLKNVKINTDEKEDDIWLCPQCDRS